MQAQKIKGHTDPTEVSMESESRISTMDCKVDGDPLGEYSNLRRGRTGDSTLGLEAHHGGWSDKIALTIVTGSFTTTQQTWNTSNKIRAKFPPCCADEPSAKRADDASTVDVSAGLGLSSLVRIMALLEMPSWKISMSSRRR